MPKAFLDRIDEFARKQAKVWYGNLPPEEKAELEKDGAKRVEWISEAEKEVQEELADWLTAAWVNIGDGFDL